MEWGYKMMKMMKGDDGDDIFKGYKTVEKQSWVNAGDKMKNGIDPCKEKKKQNIDKRDLRSIETCGKVASKVKKWISENKLWEALR